MTEPRTPPILAHDVREIAAGAKVSEAKVWQEIASGALETIVIGDRRLATPKQIEQWLERKAEHARERRAARLKARETEAA
jgi:hypothetical protein